MSPTSYISTSDESLEVSSWDYNPFKHFLASEKSFKKWRKFHVL